MNDLSLTHQDFVRRYKAGEISIQIVKGKAGDFVLSTFADKHNKPAHLFWTWLGIVLTIPVPIALLFIKWYYAPLAFLLGLLVVSGARKAAGQFVMQNMLESEAFWEYVLLHDGAELYDNDGKELKSEFLEKMGERFGRP